MKNNLMRLLLIFLIFFGGCSEHPEKNSGITKNNTEKIGEEREPAYGDILIEGSIGDASNLIPLLSSDSASHGIAGLIFNGLVKYDKNLVLTGDLAESWEISEDGLTITFYLREKVKWHDGREFTAEDVLFGYKTIIDPKVPTAYAGDFMEVEKAEILDKFTFRVAYKKPFAPALGSWGSMVILPKHLLDGVDITKSPLSRHPIGTGPYKFKEWKTGEKIVLTVNPDYFEGKPYIGGYIYRIIPDPATMFLELKTGGIDQMGLNPIQFIRQANSPKMEKNFNKYKYLAFAYTYLGYNLKNPLFQDKRVRQAITYAIDKEEIIEGVLLGLGETATGPYKPGTWQYNPRVKRFPHDPKKAEELLKAAGWTGIDGDGILTKDGLPFEFTILTNQGNDQRAKSAEIIQRRLKDIGIKVKIRTVEWAAFINEFIDKKDFEAVILGWSLGQDPDIYDIWYSKKTGPKELNFISYGNPRVDKLLEEGRHAFDLKKRKECYFELQEILAEEQPYTFLYVPYSLPIIHSRFRGIDPAPAGIGHNFIKWYVPQEEQKYHMTP